jgi:translation initiation factor 1
MFEMGAKFDDGWSLEKDNIELKKEFKSYKDHRLTFAREKRRGKIVTIVKPFFLDKKEMKSILKTLKKKLAIGGSIKDDTLEFQGEVKDRLNWELKEIGFGFKN